MGVERRVMDKQTALDVVVEVAERKVEDARDAVLKTPELLEQIKEAQEAIETVKEEFGVGNNDHHSVTRHVVVAWVPGDYGEAAGALVLEVHTDSDICDPMSALRQASVAFLRTETGKAYMESINHSPFNIGDASLTLPPEILARHGIYQMGVLTGDTGGVRFVSHDAPLAKEIN